VNYGAEADASTGCPDCGEPIVPADRWCEACGASVSAALPATAHAGAPWSSPDASPPADLGPTGGSMDWPRRSAVGGTACPACGAPTSGDHSWCGRCQRAWARPRHHHEVVDGPVAAVTDQGKRHWRNEDAVGVQWVEGYPGGFALVVCDGISVSQDPHVVAQVAVDSALRVLSGAVAAAGDLGVAMAEASAAAQRAAAAVPHDPTLDVGPGACTLVAAVVRGAWAAFASVGDSRAYWVDARGAVQIGQDDSVAAELMASGRLTAAQAMERPQAHALTKWLGVDAGDDAPNVTVVELPGPGLVVLASDGLWKYAPTPEDMARLIGPIGTETTIDLARRLTSFANASGGADNITVAVGAHRINQQEGR
jgi:serine/threonine protein phosphatase PrpC